MSNEQNNQDGSIDDVVNSSAPNSSVPNSSAPNNSAINGFVPNRDTPAGNASSMRQQHEVIGDPLPPLRLPVVLPLEKYVTLFTNNYSADPSFKLKVHNYLKLSRFKKVGLNLGKVFRKSWYEKKTQEMITTYATRAHDDLEKYCNAKKTEWESKREEIELKKKQAELSESEKIYQNTQQEFQSVTAKEKEERAKAQSEFEAKQRAIQDKAEKQRVQIINRTDVNRIVQEQLEKTVKKSSYVKVDAAGNLKFDEEQIVQRLEDLYLDQIIEGIEKEDGKTGGFMTKILKEYGDILSHFEELGDVSDLPDVDWPQSIIYSVTRGYRVPTFPYLVVGKKQPKTANGKIQIDTAQILDISGSMTHNDRINIAKKTLLANSALMRRLNPSNNMYMGVYSDGVRDITSSDLFRSVAADGYTRTDLALEWLFEKLENAGPSIAYLVTDGEPYHPNVDNMMERCIEYAGKFKKLPIMLTIFLIDGDASSEANIIKIGQAAGPDTKVIPVGVSNLGSGVIRAGADNIHNMYSIGDFARR